MTFHMVGHDRGHTCQQYASLHFTQTIDADSKDGGLVSGSDGECLDNLQLGLENGRHETV